MHAETGLFDVFNARFVEPERVGSTFVLSPFLRQVVGPSNTAILGPRGSGKTTLLKMLTLPGLLAWNHPQKSDIVSEIDYISVYIPASLTWSAEYRSFSNKKLRADLEALLSTSLFRHNIMLSLISTLRDFSNPSLRESLELGRFFVALDLSKEHDFCQELATVWDLPLRISNLAGLRNAVSTRIRTIQKIIIESSIFGSSADNALANHTFLAAHFLDDIVAFLDFLERNMNFKRRLAVCFDEVEIAPDAVARAILRAPRSIDQRIIVKFSAAPYVSSALTSHQPTIPTHGNDFDIVFLTSFSTRQTRGFSEALFTSLCHRYDIDNEPSEVLGASLIDIDDMGKACDSSEDSGEASFGKYSVGGAYQKRFEALSKIDPSFRAYLDHRGVDVSDLSAGSEVRRAADIRKILWPVMIRQEFLFVPTRTSSEQVDNVPGRPGRRLRSRSPIGDIYTGAGSIFAICEGNPRWLLGLLEPVAREYSKGAASGNQRSVLRSFQREQIQRMIAAYFALISTIPTSKSSRAIHSLVDLIDRIGTYFQHGILAEQFNPDPVLAFTVDQDVSPPIHNLIGRGINIGAFVTSQEVPGDRGYRVGDIAGLKVRLSNIFAPRFKLPLAGGRSIRLSRILSRAGSSITPTLEDLFGDRA